MKPDKDEWNWARDKKFDNRAKELLNEKCDNEEVEAEGVTEKTGRDE